MLGGGGSSKVSSKDKAVLDLKLQRDKVKQYQKRLVLVEQKERELAKQSLAAGNRKRALLFLRKEKFQSQLLEKSFAQLASLEELLESIEFAQIQQDIVRGLKHGADTLKAINAEVSIDDVERIMDDSAAGIAYQHEVEQALNAVISEEDEQAIEEELAKMQQEVLPSVPTSKLASANQSQTEKLVVAKSGQEGETEAIPA